MKYFAIVCGVCFLGVVVLSAGIGAIGFISARNTANRAERSPVMPTTSANPSSASTPVIPPTVLVSQSKQELFPPFAPQEKWAKVMDLWKNDGRMPGDLLGRKSNGFGKIIYLNQETYHFRAEQVRSSIVVEMKVYGQTELTRMEISESGADNVQKRGKWSDLKKGTQVYFSGMNNVTIGNPEPGARRDSGVCLSLVYYVPAP